MTLFLLLLCLLSDDDDISLSLSLIITCPILRLSSLFSDPIILPVLLSL